MRPALHLCVLFVLTGGIMVETGCGRKAPPLPPELRVADTTRDLQVVQDERMARLRWSYPNMTTAGGPLPDLESIEVWRADLPLAQEPPAGTTAKDRQVRWNLLEARGAIIFDLQGEGLDRATHGSALEIEDDLEQSLSASDSEMAETVVWYAVRSICCRGRKSDFSNIARLVPRIASPPPEGLEVTAEKEGPRLTWTPTEDRLVQVERSGDGERWKTASEPPVSESTWTDQGAAQGHTWFYRLRTVTATSDGKVTRKGAPGPVVQVEYPDLYPPETPVDLVCLPEGGRVRLRWRASEGANGYSVERRAGQAEIEVLAEAISEVFFLDAAPPSGNVTYTIRAVDKAGNVSSEARCRTIVEGSE